MSDTSPRILIAGASGYIGRALIPELLRKFPDARITALSRMIKPSTDPRVTWVSCDLFSLKSLEAAVPKPLDLAVYLVHSMSPTAYVDQGSFADYDVIMADNFARAVKSSGVKQVMYLGGLTPDAAHLSRHLESRLEVEETFRQYRLPTTTFRAGLILGEGGSSFQILLKLVKRLPIMVCPRWTPNADHPGVAEPGDARDDHRRPGRRALEPNLRPIGMLTAQLPADDARHRPALGAKARVFDVPLLHAHVVAVVGDVDHQFAQGPGLPAGRIAGARDGGASRSRLPGHRRRPSLRRSVARGGRAKNPRARRDLPPRDPGRDGALGPASAAAQGPRRGVGSRIATSGGCRARSFRFCG